MEVIFLGSSLLTWSVVAESNSISRQEWRRRGITDPTHMPTVLAAAKLSHGPWLPIRYS